MQPWLSWPNPPFQPGTGVNNRTHRTTNLTAGMTSTVVDQFATYPPPGGQENYPVPDNPSPNRSDDSGGPRTHRRGYQACENCRGRKSKCVLGSKPWPPELFLTVATLTSCIVGVDNPGEPPCDRCRRERRECYFAPTRKKKRSSNDPTTPDRPVKRLLTSTSMEDESKPNFRQTESPYPSNDVPTRQWNVPVPQHQHQPHYTSQPREMTPSSYANSTGNNTAHFRSELVNDTLHTAAATTQDNLNVLYRAAIETSAISDGAGQNKSPSSAFGSPVTAGSAHPRTFSNNTMKQRDPSVGESPVQGGNNLQSNKTRDEGLQSAVRAWERMRFVRAGWFKAQEAMQYVE